MNICIISYMYPGKHNSNDFVFVKQLVDEFSKLGNDISVVCPYNVLHYRKYSPVIEQYSSGGGKVVVYRPWYISFSNIKIGSFNPSEWMYQKALKKALRKIPKPDAVYGHFWRYAFGGFCYAKQNGLPLFVASGESEIKFRNTKKTYDFCEYVTGVICVSTKNKDESIYLRLTTEDKCIVAPNAINTNLFHLLDRSECRNILTLPQDVFIVAFCGSFIHRKGVKILSEAINSIKGEPVYSLFMGRPGDELPSCKNILFQGPVPHDKLAVYLNAADVFVLPTLHEGCCNAIIEAMACGLPLISSDRPFNWDVLNESNSILVDPESIEDIASAITELRDNIKKRSIMSHEVLNTAKQLDINKRAEKIITFIKEKSGL